MQYEKTLASWERKNIYGRIDESSVESPIDLFFTNGTFYCVFGRTVEGEKWKKRFEIDHLCSIMGKEMLIPRNDKYIFVTTSRTRLSAILKDVSHRLEIQNRLH